MRYLKHILSLRVLLSLLLVFLQGCAVVPSRDFSLPAPLTISSAEERVLGRALFQRLRQEKGGRYIDEALSRYVSSVGQGLAQHSQQKGLVFRFEVLNDSVPDAFAFPGGYIGVTRGLLARLSNETELATILGHEIGHVISRHALRDMPADLPSGDHDDLFLGENAVAISGMGHASVGGVVTYLRGKRFSREQENAADQLAFEYMDKAGYNLSGVAQAMADLSRELENHEKSPQSRRWPIRHPVTAPRSVDNRESIAANPPQRAVKGADAELFIQAFEHLKQFEAGYALYDQARLAEVHNDLSLAMTLYHRSLLEAPEEPLIMCHLGLAYLRQEDLIPARRYLIKSVNIQGDYYQSRLGLGYVYQHKQQYHKAQQQLEIGVRLYPTLEGAFMLAEARADNDDIDGARKLYQAVVKADNQGTLGRNAASRLLKLEY